MSAGLNSLFVLHIGVVRPAAAFWRYPGDILRRVFNVAGFAVHAVLKVNLKAWLSGAILNHFIDTGRAVALCRFSVLWQVVADW